VTVLREVVYKHFPLRNHKQARPAAVASMAAHQQGKFWEYHDKIFADYRNLKAGRTPAS
jgi:protein-disulfide isomerase